MDLWIYGSGSTMDLMDLWIYGSGSMDLDLDLDVDLLWIYYGSNMDLWIYYGSTMDLNRSIPLCTARDHSGPHYTALYRSRAK